MANSPLITLLTDFGLTDHYVAAMKGVILGICPEARIVDISHEIKAFGIMEAAFVLSQAYPCFPEGSIHVVVVDPGVGSSRKPLLVQADDHWFVGPDNGVFTFPLERDRGAAVREINGSRYFRHPVSNTFHGRDIFAPISAHLASGVEVCDLAIDIPDAVRLEINHPVRESDGSWKGNVLYVDHYGNLVTSFRTTDIYDIVHAGFELTVGEVRTSSYRTDYSNTQTSGVFVIAGSSGYLEVSSNQKDTGQAAVARPGSAVTIRPISSAVPASD